MVNLPGSVLWICLFVHLIQGQISDNISTERVNSDPDDAKNAVNETKTQGSEDKKGKENPELETKEEEAGIRQFPVRPQELNLAYLSEPANGREKRRRITYRAEAANVTEYPQISMERRKSYLSIAERRKFYNRTRVQGKKTETPQRDVLQYQETSNRPTVSQERILLMNEIRENRQNDVKDSSKIVSEGRNDTQNQRIVLGMLKNETLPKMDNVNQSVIYSHVEFGQKLSLRKTTMRVQDLRNVKPRRRKEKTREEAAVVNSTNKISKNIETQSTKLLKVDDNHWSTTENPKGEIEAENFVMPWKKNKTSIEKVGKYIKNSPYDSQIRRTLLGRTAAVAKENIVPLPLSYEGEYTDAFKEVATTEINDAGITTDPSGEITTTGTISATLDVTDIPYGMTRSLNETDILLSTSDPRMNTSTVTTRATTTTTTARIPYRKLYHPPVEYKSRYNYTRRPPVKSASTTEKIINKTWSPSVTIAERMLTDRTKKLSHSETRKWKPSSTTTTSTRATTETGINTEGYPLTIEINENNKRVLSEMFWTTTEREQPKAFTVSTTKRYSQSDKFTKKNKDANVKTETEKVSTTLLNAPTIADSESTVPATLANVTAAGTTKTDVKDSDEDHKSVGTSFNTKFYIIPNVTKTEVIKIVETEEDTENEVLVTAQTVGIAIYILAAFGLIPLLLALVFGAKFFVRKHRRKDDCDSDLRSDISGNENHPRQGKIGSELKKSPSNVTTTTLVATTRLPRVHHWENYEKGTNKNWEFPRSKLKLLTILGQGNFGQVWKAEAEDVSSHEGLTRLVAVKTVKEGATEKEHGELIKELEIMQQMGSHPNIVTLLGCCTDQEPYYLIMEYVMYGKLLTYLREHRMSETYYNISNSSDALTSRDLTVFAYCVARGMEYLSSRGIIHRDLAARNVLVDHNKLCKIADFGMSRSVRDSEDGQLYEERQHKGALPIRWMAPESLLYSIFTHKSDVWSFGIVLWEIVTLGSTPYPNMGAREVMKKVREGYRLERPHHCRHELYQLISHCWAHDPNKRPDFGELRRELTNLLDDTSKDGIYVDLDSFAVSNRFHVSNSNNNNNNNNIIMINGSNNFGKTNDFRLIERNEVRTVKRLDNWDGQDWSMENRKVRCKRTRNNGKGTVTLTGHGSFTVNSRILEKEFKMV